MTAFHHAPARASRERSSLARTGLSATIALFVSIAFAAVLPAIAGAAWTGTTELPPAGPPGKPYTVVVDSRGVATAIWTGAADGKLYASQRSGSNWSTPIAITSPASGETDVNPVAAVLPDDRIVVVWRTNVDANENGAVFSATIPKDLTPQFNPGSPFAISAGENSVPDNPALVVDAAGVATVAWIASGGYRIKSRRLVSGTWGTTEIVRSTTSLPRDLDMAAAPNGAAALVWQEDGGPGVYYASFASSAWSTPETVEPVASGWSAGAANVVVDAAGLVTVVWAENRLDQAQNHIGNVFARQRSGAAAWGSVVTLNSSGSQAFRPDAAIDGNGVVTVAWDSYFSGPGQISATRFAGGSWSAAEVVSGDAINTAQPAVAAFNGGAVVTWWGDSGGIGAALYVGAAWSRPMRIGTGVIPQIAQRAGATSGAGIAVLFADERNNAWNMTANSLEGDQAPGTISAVRTGGLAGAVNVAWDAAPEGGWQTAYSVTLSPGNHTCVTTATRCLISGLTSGQTYSVRVVPSNPYGEGGAATGTATAGSAATSLMYWGAYYSDSVSVARSDGGAARDIATSAGGPFGSTVDPAAGRVYWIAYNRLEIWHSDVDGDNAAVLNTGAAPIADPEGITLDPTTGTLYWAELASGRIAYARTDGSGGGVLVENDPGISSPISPIVDPTSGRLYWANSGANTVGYVSLDAPSVVHTITPGCGTIDSVDTVLVDTARSTLYVAGREQGSGQRVVQRMDLDGSACAVIADGYRDAIWGATYDPEYDRLIFAEIDGDTMQYVDLATGLVGEIPIAGAGMDDPAWPVVVARPQADRATAIETTSTGIGATLTCSPPTWGIGVPGMAMYRAPASTTIGWTRDGVAIPGADGVTLTATAGGAYACVVTASNVAGATTSTSDAVTIVAPPQDPPVASGSSSATSGATTTPSSPGTIRLRGRGAVQVGNVLLTEVDVSGPGVIQQIGWVTANGRKARACATRVKVKRAGRVTVRCVLRKRVLRVAARSTRTAVAVPLELRTTFIPDGGAPTATNTALVVRAIPARPSVVTG